MPTPQLPTPAQWYAEQAKQIIDDWPASADCPELLDALLHEGEADYDQ